MGLFALRRKLSNLMPSGRVSLRFILAYAAASVVFGIVVLEVALRLLNLHEPLVWKPHPELGWEHIPGARKQWTEEGNGWIEINEFGFRDRQRSLEKPTDAFRVAVFGDSQTEAVQVNLDQTFSYVLEERLSTTSKPVEVINFGVNGYSPIQELLLMQQVVPLFQPDLIVVAVFLDNDVSGCSPTLNVNTGGAPFLNREALPELDYDFSLAQSSYEQFQREPKHMLRKLSGIYRLLYRIKNQRAAPGASEANSDFIPKRHNLYDESQTQEWSQAWQVFESVIKEIRNFSEHLGIPLIVVSIPAGQAVNNEAWTRIVNKYPAMKNRTWDLDQGEVRLGEIGVRLGITVVQPYEKFRKKVPLAAPLYFGDVGHLTEHGHQEMASAMEQEVRKYVGKSSP